MLSFRLRTSAGNPDTELTLDQADVTLIERDVLASSVQITGPREAMETCFVTESGDIDYRRGLFVDDGPTARISARLAQVQFGYRTTTCTWVSDDVALWNRLAYPNPAQAWDSQTADYWTHTSAPAETIALDLIKAQVGPTTALAYRRTPLTVPTSQGRGAARSAQLRFDNVGRYVTDLAEATGLRFDVRQPVGSTQPVVSVRQVVDRSEVSVPAVPARFGSSGTGGPVGRLADDSFVVRVGSPTANTVLGAGGGDLAARMLREATDADSVTSWGRVEILNDQSGTDNTAALDQSNASVLVEQANPVEISGVSIVQTEGLIFCTDILLGDTVEIDVYRAVPLKGPLRQVTTTIKDSTTTVIAAVGSVDAGLTRDQKSYLKQARALRKANT